MAMPSTSSMSNKKKRVRTSFKHQQLRAMKAYFQINPNPDAKDLKELSERTGLQKRVLQVWFHNSSSSSSTVNRTISPNPLSMNAKSLGVNYNDNKSDKNYNRVLSQYLDDQHGNNSSSQHSQAEMNPSSNNSNFLSNSNSLLFPDDEENCDFEMGGVGGGGNNSQDELVDDDEENMDEDEENEVYDDAEGDFEDSASKELNEETATRRLETVDFELVDSKSNKNICKEISSKIQNTNKRLKKQSSKSSAKLDTATRSQSSAVAEANANAVFTDTSYQIMSSHSMNLVNQPQNENFMMTHESYHHHHHHHGHHEILHMGHYHQQPQQQHFATHPAPSLEYFCF